MMKLYKVIASHGNMPSVDYDAIEDLLPSGSGFDSGTEVDWEQVTNKKIVLKSAYHHMDEHGGYDGWSHFRIVITPDLVYGFDLKLKSIGRWWRKYESTKEYIEEVFWDALDSNVIVEWVPGHAPTYKFEEV